MTETIGTMDGKAAFEYCKEQIKYHIFTVDHIAELVSPLIQSGAIATNTTAKSYARYIMEGRQKGTKQHNRTGKSPVYENLGDLHGSLVCVYRFCEDAVDEGDENDRTKN